MGALAVEQAASRSRYVKRCLRCKVVRGSSQFRNGSAVCRFCHAAKSKAERDAREATTRLERLRKEQRSQRAALRAVKRELYRIAQAIQVLEQEARQQESLPL